MKLSSYSKLSLISFGIVFFPTLIGLLINLLTNDEEVRRWFLDRGIGTKQLLIGVVISGAVFFVLTYLQLRNEKVRQTSKEDDISDQNIEPDVKKLVDSLKGRYKNRYYQKLDGRYEITLEVHENWDDKKPREFREEYDETMKSSPAAEYIKETFKEKGRLLIVGNPGVGKTVLLLKLALNLLNHVDFLRKDPFPVIFNLASWSIEYEKFDDWLIAMLGSNNGLSRGFAETLLTENRLILFLDGLDELAQNKSRKAASNIRAECLNSLNSYLREGRAAIICCRTEEFLLINRLTGQRAPVAAKVKILDLSPAQILFALEQAISGKNPRHHASAKNLRNILHESKNSDLLEVLRTPFYFTVAMQIFDREILTEQNLPRVIGQVRRYLIENFVKEKILFSANPQDFDPLKTVRWLRWLALFLVRKQNVAFELADLQPLDLARPSRYLLIMRFLGGFLPCIAFGIIYHSLIAMLFSFAVFYLLSCLVYRSYKIETDVNQWNFKELFNVRNGLWALTAGFAVGALVTLSLWIFNPLLASLSIGIIFTAAGTAYALIVSCRRVMRLAYIENAYQRIRGAIFFNIVEQSLWFCMIAGATYLAQNIPEFAIPVTGLIEVMLSLGLISGILATPIIQHSILRLCFYIEGSMPLQYVRFLSYSTDLRILEKDGGFWRFRHQNLQDYFAAAEKG